MKCHQGDFGIFETLDANGNGKVSPKEWSRFCEKLTQGKGAEFTQRFLSLLVRNARELQGGGGQSGAVGTSAVQHGAVGTSAVQGGGGQGGAVGTSAVQHGAVGTSAVQGGASVMATSSKKSQADVPALHPAASQLAVWRSRSQTLPTPGVCTCLCCLLCRVCPDDVLCSVQSHPEGAGAPAGPSAG